ncbi:MAG: sulfotransferase [Elusimicrobia bacterium]|nr:sulfotransferase [Elusimicrobiota bacterium]
MPEPRQVLQLMDRTQVLLLYYWGRSGTLFLQSLLDSHPEVLTLPGCALMLFHVQQWDWISEESAPEKRIARFCEHPRNAALFDGSKDKTDGLAALGPGRDTPLSVDQEAFRRHMLAILAAAGRPDRGTFFLAAHFAYALARGEEIGRKRVIVYQMHSADPIATRNTLADFPGRVKAIGMVRHPMRALNSHLRMRLLQSRANPAHDGAANTEYHLMVRTGVYAGYYKHQLVGWTEIRRYFDLPLLPVKLEDLHSQPRREMEKVAAWAGIGWDDSLLKSTFNGLQYWGDPQAVKPMQGFSTSHTQYQGWQEQFDSLDQCVIAGLLGKGFERYGYWSLPAWQRLLCPFLVLLPTKLERRAWACAARESSGRALLQIARSTLARYDLSYRHLLKSVGWVDQLYRRYMAPRRKLYYRY